MILSITGTICLKAGHFDEAIKYLARAHELEGLKTQMAAGIVANYIEALRSGDQLGKMVVILVVAWFACNNIKQTNKQINK